MPTIIELLTNDELGLVADGLADLLQPRLLVHFSSTCRFVRRSLHQKVAKLRAKQELLLRTCGLQRYKSFRFRTPSGTLSSKDDRTNADRQFVKDTTQLFKGLWRGALPSVAKLSLFNIGLGPNGAEVLAAALCCGAFPFVADIELAHNVIGPEGAIALAAALRGGALRNLLKLNLIDNMIGAQGAIALASPLRSLPSLRVLNLAENDIGDKAAAALFGNLDESNFKAIKELDLKWNQLGDAVCSDLLSAIWKGAMPELVHVFIGCNDLIEFTERHFDKALREIRPLSLKDL
jgi:hypothetical protein